MVTEAAAAADSAVVGGMICGRAVENACASEAQATNRLAAVMAAGGDQAVVRAAAKAAASVSKRRQEAQTAAQRALERSRIARSAADQAAALLAELDGGVLKLGEEQKVLAKIDRLAGDAKSAAAEVAVIAEEMKRRWLALSVDPSIGALASNVSPSAAGTTVK